jgi:hypothetical protein
LPLTGTIESNRLDQAIDTLREHVVRDIEQPAVEIERFLGIEEAIQVRLFRKVAKPLILADVRGILTENERLAFGRE